MASEVAAESAQWVRCATSIQKEPGPKVGSAEEEDGKLSGGLCRSGEEDHAYADDEIDGADDGEEAGESVRPVPRATRCEPGLYAGLYVG